MLPTHLTSMAALRSTFLAAALASSLSAQHETWKKQVGTSDNEDVGSVASDGVGGAYLVGRTSGSLFGVQAGEVDAWFMRVDSAGSPIWTRQLGTPNHDDASAVASDGAGGVFIGGSTSGTLGAQNLGSHDVWLAHYNGAGNQTWLVQFGTNTLDLLHAATPDGMGGLFVSGSSFGSFGGPAAGWMDAWVTRFDRAGNQLWIRQVGSPRWDCGNGLASDGAGGVFIGGETDGSLGGPNASALNDAWLAHFDGAGNQTWLRQFGTIQADRAFACAADDAGGVFLGGITEGSLGGPNAGDQDVWVARYDGAGNQLWIRQFGTAAWDNCATLAPDGAGGIFVGGSTVGDLGGVPAGGADAWLAHYDSAGTLSWIQQRGTTGADYGTATTSDGMNGVFTVGGTSGDFGGPNAGSMDVWLALYDVILPTSHCSPAVVNSTGRPGVLRAAGSGAAQVNDVTLNASQLPSNAFGYCFSSQTPGVATNPGGSQGNLCLAGAIGRYVGAGQVQSTGTNGAFSLALDLAQTPTPAGFVSISAGQSWVFQAWHRDLNPTPTSNFTDAVIVAFR